MHGGIVDFNLTGLYIQPRFTVGSLVHYLKVTYFKTTRKFMIEKTHYYLVLI